MFFIACAYCSPKHMPLLSQYPVSQAVQAPAASLVQVKQLALSSHPEVQQGIAQSAGCCIYNNIDLHE